MTDNDEINAQIRRAAGRGRPAPPDESAAPEPAPADFGGGAREPAPPGPPSMNDELRATFRAGRSGGTPGDYLPPR